VTHLRRTRGWVAGVMLLTGKNSQNRKGHQRRTGLFGEDYCGYLWHWKPHKNLCCTLGHGTENVSPGRGGWIPVRTVCIKNKAKGSMNTIDFRGKEQGKHAPHEVFNYQKRLHTYQYVPNARWRGFVFVPYIIQGGDQQRRFQFNSNPRLKNLPDRSLT
jgi:hypothetical protein